MKTRIPNSIKTLKQNLLKGLCFIVLSTLCLHGVAQSVTITGKVSDDQGGLPTASVVVKETNAGTVTDMEGNYSIQAEKGQTLIFRFIGYADQEIVVGESTVINATMKPETQQLGTVTVYIPMEKKDITGAMESIGSEDFNTGVINTPDQLFTGKVTGVAISPEGGEPGGAVKINIRGNSSFRAGGDPLIVVDGFPLDGRDVSSTGFSVNPLGGSTARSPLNFINPKDIASIDILKDASASAIYGARGANGVIMINTKRAESSKPTLEYGTSFSVASIRKPISIASADEYREYFKDSSQTYKDERDFGGNTNWLDEITQTGITQAHNLAFGQTTEKGAYRFSLGYQNQEGIIKKSGQEKITARFSGSQKSVKDIVETQYNISFTRLNDQYAPISNSTQQGSYFDALGSALFNNPTVPVTDSLGNFTDRTFTNDGGFQVDGDGSKGFLNPAAMIAYFDDKSRTNRFIGNLRNTIHITEGLDFITSIGSDQGNSIRRTYIDPKFQNVNTLRIYEGIAVLQQNVLESYIMENFASYTKELRDNKLTLLAGYSYQKFISRNSWSSYGNLIELIGFNSIQGANLLPVGFDGTTTSAPYGANEQTNKLQSFFGRANFDYKSKLLLTASLRIDGSSRFGSNNRYGTFPSAAIAYRLTEEEFIPKVFDDLKLRVGYGITGNQEIPNGISKAQFVPDITSPGQGNLVITSVPNPDIKWEESQQLNIGLDFAILKGKLTGTFDYFNKQTTDLLALVPVAAPAPSNTVWTNLDAVVKNQGVELGLNYLVLDNKEQDLSVNVGVNGTYFLQNVLTDYTAGELQTGDPRGRIQVPLQLIDNDEALGSFNLLEHRIEGDSILLSDSASIAGTAAPTLIYGMNITARYKNFDLGIAFEGKAGNEVYNVNNMLLDPSTAVQGNLNVNTELPRYNYRSTGLFASDYFLENASYLRLNNITLGYTLTGEKLGEKFDWLSTARVYISGQNVFVLTQYTGFDPDVNVNVNPNLPSQGLDYTSYPRPRVWSVGADITF